MMSLSYIVKSKHVIITSKRCFDLMITHLLRCLFAGSQGVVATEGIHPERILIQWGRNKWPRFADDIFRRIFLNEDV